MHLSPVVVKGSKIFLKNRIEPCIIIAHQQDTDSIESSKVSTASFKRRIRISRRYRQRIPNLMN